MSVFFNGLFILLLASGFAYGRDSEEPTPPYNEVHGSDGQVRESVRQVQRLLPNWLNPSPRDVETLTHKALGDSIRILPLGLALTTSEEERIRAGARQSAEALRLLFYDLVIGSQDIIRQRKLFSRRFVETIFEDENRNLTFYRRIWRGRSLQDISFIAGPDIVRNERGDFVVLEYNVGAIGGIGDVQAVQDAFFGMRFGGTRPDLPNDLAQAVIEFVHSTGRSIDHPEVVAIVDDDVPSGTKVLSGLDLEDQRRVRILESTGIRSITSAAVKGMSESDRKLFWKKHKVFVNLENPFADPWLDFREFHEYFARNKDVRLFRGLGADQLGNKALLPYMDEIIRFYTKSEPIIPTQPTRTLVGKAPKLRSGVVKRVNSGQGSEVYILKNLAPIQIGALKESIRDFQAYSQGRIGLRDFPFFVIQDQVTPSIIPVGEWMGFFVDIRPHTYVFGNQTFVSHRLWGRAVSSVGEGLNNVSRGAFELVVVTSRDCQDYLVTRATTEAGHQ